jgi:hypothetical protein
LLARPVAVMRAKTTANRWTTGASFPPAESPATATPDQLVERSKSECRSRFGP